ncbi:hypothetical protein SS05631_b64070 (plasmid) [Sinorhizobium sp. CCBAU 05631]|nr:hypothetical protein SS05631_b64070 [Sinorhizobium sp. CCBAU 05631]
MFPCPFDALPRLDRSLAGPSLASFRINVSRRRERAHAAARVKTVPMQ